MDRKPYAARAGFFTGIAAILFVGHLWLIAPILQNGDAAVYNEQIERHVLSIRTTHVGYMLLGICANKLLPFDTEQNLNLMNLAFASAGAVALFAIARRYGVSLFAASIAPLLAFGLRPYLRGAVMAEVDVVACSAVLLAIAAWVHGRRVLAGFLFGIAMLVTPISALSLPVFALAPRQKTVEPQLWSLQMWDVFVFGAASLAVYFPIVAWNWQDYWNGGRGIVHAPRQPWDVAEQVTRSVRFLTSSATSWLGIGLAGIFAKLSGGPSLALGTSVAVICAAVMGERFLDVPVQLPQLCLFAVFATWVMDRLPTKKISGYALGAVWLLAAIPTYQDVRREVNDKLELREIYRAMAQQTPKLMVVGLLKPAPPDILAPFAYGWRREFRSILGRSYEVWLPLGDHVGGIGG